MQYLTPEEKDLVIKAMNEYPLGVPSLAWGFGPIQIDHISDPDDNEPVYPPPETISKPIEDICDTMKIGKNQYCDTVSINPKLMAEQLKNA